VTEEQIIFNKASRDRLLRHGTVANGVPALAGQPAAPILNELHLMALSHELRYYADHSSVQGEPHNAWVGVPHDPERYGGAPVPGEAAIEGGGIETLCGKDGMHKTKTMQSEVLSVPLGLLLDKRTRQADGKRRGVDMDRLFASFINITGGFLPGETFVQGLNIGRSMYDEYTVKPVPADFQITIDNPNRTQRSRGTKILGPTYKTGGGVTVTDKVFPSQWKQFTIKAGANLFDLIQHEHSVHNTGEPLPAEWTAEACEFACQQVVAVLPSSKTVSVRVSRGVASIADTVMAACGIEEDQFELWTVRATFGDRQLVIGDRCLEFWTVGPEDGMVAIAYEGVDASPVSSPAGQKRKAPFDQEGAQKSRLRLEESAGAASAPQP